MDPINYGTLAFSGTANYFWADKDGATCGGGAGCVGNTETPFQIDIGAE
jgi:hypothetical protein